VDNCAYLGASLQTPAKCGYNLQLSSIVWVFSMRAIRPHCQLTSEVTLSVVGHLSPTAPLPISPERWDRNKCSPIGSRGQRPSRSTAASVVRKKEAGADGSVKV
jgi:hypothetical protein